eukprot:IDg17655t1
MRAPPMTGAPPFVPFTLMDIEYARIDAVTVHTIVSRWLSNNITDWETVYFEKADTVISKLSYMRGGVHAAAALERGGRASTVRYRVQTGRAARRLVRL